MAGYAGFAVALPGLVGAWHLSASGAGWIGGAYFLGYVVAVPVLVGLTDRADTRAIYVASALLGVAGQIGFATLAHGFWSAALVWSLAGAALAGTYMPGLRLLTERLDDALRLRVVPYYTASFGIGGSLSFLVAGFVLAAWGWRAIFLVGAVGSAISAVLVTIATLGTNPLPGSPVRPSPRHALDFRPVLANRAVLRYVIAYGGHCWELFATRAWLVAYLLFVWNRTVGGDPGHRLTVWSTAIVFIGVPASILGAEIASRRGRRWIIALVAVASVATGIVVAAFGGGAFGLAVALLLVYSILVTGDSGAITAGVVDVAPVDAQGATLAVHALAGALGGALGPITVGLVLQAFGGLASPAAWTVAYLTMAAGSVVAALAMRSISSRTPSLRSSSPSESQTAVS